MKYLIAIPIIFWVFLPPISTPSLVTDLDDIDDETSIQSTSATPSEHALIIKICYTLDTGLGAHDLPTDDWANTPTWTEIQDNKQAFSISSMAWTTTGISPGAGQVSQGFTEEVAEIGLAIIEITGVNLSSPIVASNAGGNEASSTLSITVSGTLGPNDVMVSGMGSRQDTDGVTVTSPNILIATATTPGNLASTHQVQYNVTDLVAAWGDIDGTVVNATGVAVHIRGLNNIMIGGIKPKVRILYSNL